MPNKAVFRLGVSSRCMVTHRHPACHRYFEARFHSRPGGPVSTAAGRKPLLARAGQKSCRGRACPVPAAVAVPPPEPAPKALSGKAFGQRSAVPGLESQVVRFRLTRSLGGNPRFVPADNKPVAGGRHIHRVLSPYRTTSRFDLRRAPHILLCASTKLKYSGRSNCAGPPQPTRGIPRGPGRWVSRFARQPDAGRDSRPGEVPYTHSSRGGHAGESGDPRWEAQCKQEAQERVISG
jgi:hypothetical protein